MFGAHSWGVYAPISSRDVKGPCSNRIFLIQRLSSNWLNGGPRLQNTDWHLTNDTYRIVRWHDVRARQPITLREQACQCLQPKDHRQGELGVSGAVLHLEEERTEGEANTHLDIFVGFWRAADRQNILSKELKKKKVGRQNVEYVRISEQMSKVVRERRQCWERSAGGR